MKYFTNHISIKVTVLIFLFISTISCMENLQDDEKMETIPIPEGIKVGSVELGPNYTNNAYYNLAGNKAVKTGTNFDFDLQFECTDAGWHILLNSAIFMHAGNAHTKNFDEVVSHAGLDMNFDPSSGNLDSTAVGTWFTVIENDTTFHNDVYVIDLGLDEIGTPLGYKKVIFEKLSLDVYTLRHANLDGSQDFTTTIEKDPSVNFIGFSFDGEGSIVNLQPETGNWDLFFGQYTTLLYAGEEPYPYLVRGTLTNRVGIQSMLYDGEKSFTDFDYNDALSITFSSNADEIGHDWKYYNLEEGFYSVRTENVYVIRNASGDFYKMHFLSYFNSEGQTGYPQFEFMKLIP